MNLDEIKIYKEDLNRPDIMVDKLFKSFNYFKEQHFFSDKLEAAKLIHEQNLRRFGGFMKKEKLDA